MKEIEEMRHSALSQATNQYSSQSRAYHPYTPCHPPSPADWQLMLARNSITWEEMPKESHLMINIAGALLKHSVHSQPSHEDL